MDKIVNDEDVGCCIGAIILIVILAFMDLGSDFLGGAIIFIAIILIVYFLIKKDKDDRKKREEQERKKVEKQAKEKEDKKKIETSQFDEIKDLLKDHKRVTELEEKNPQIWIKSHPRVGLSVEVEISITAFNVENGEELVNQTLSKLKKIVLKLNGKIKEDRD